MTTPSLPYVSIADDNIVVKWNDTETVVTTEAEFWAFMETTGSDEYMKSSSIDFPDEFTNSAAVRCLARALA